MEPVNKGEKALQSAVRTIQLTEHKDMITTIKTLNDTIVGQQSENDNLKAELA